MHRKTVFIFFVLFSLLFSSFPVRPVVAYTQDDVGGSWVDTFDDSSGIEFSSNTTISGGDIQLTDSGSGYPSSGYVVTDIIEPVGYAAWGHIDIDADTPAGTSVKVRARGFYRDGGSTIGRLYDDDYLASNSVGFDTFPADISDLRPTVWDGDGTGDCKNARLRVEIILETSSTTTTPTVNSLEVTWTKTQGDTTASSPESTYWNRGKYGNRQSTKQVPTTAMDYPAINWRHSYLDDLSDSYNYNYLVSSRTVLSEDKIISQTHDSTISGLKHFAINQSDGSLLWQQPGTTSGSAWSLADDGTIYSFGIGEDMVYALDSAVDGQMKWTYPMSCHGNSDAIMGSNGKVYVGWYGCTSADDSINNGQGTIYAFNSDGTLDYSTTTNDKTLSIFAMDDNDILYYTTRGNSDDYNRRLVAFNTATQEKEWEYLLRADTQYYGNGSLDFANPVIGDDGTIYTWSSSSGFDQTSDIGLHKIYAFNPNGTLKWEHTDTEIARGWMIDAHSLDQTNGLLLLIANYPGPYDVDAHSLTTGEHVWTDSLTDSSLFSTPPYKSIFFTDNDGSMYHSIYGLTSTGDETRSHISKHDKDRNLKWQIKAESADYESSTYPRYVKKVGTNGLLLSDNGRLFFDHFAGRQDSSDYRDYDPDSNLRWLLSAIPWTISENFGFSSDFNSWGETVNFSISSSMRCTDPLSGEANQMQVVIDNGDKVTLSCTAGAAVTENTVWTGSYLVPKTIEVGTYGYTIEANQASVETDTSVNFTSPASNSGNTGITQTGTFEIIVPSSTGFPIGYKRPPVLPFSPNKMGAHRFWINNGASMTNNRKVTLTFDTSSDTNRVIIYENDELDTAPLLDISPSIDYYLSAGEGEKTVQVKFCTQYGYCTDPVSQKIILDHYSKKCFAQNDRIDESFILKLVKYSHSPVVYFINSQNQAQAFFNAEAFLGRGYKWQDIIEVGEGTVFGKGQTLMPLGSPKLSIKKYHFTEYMYPGFVSSQVRSLQELLKSAGFYDYPHITGYYGSVTKSAVQRFQQKNGIETLGVVGPQTRKALNSL